jgi:hypothetical protein
MKARAYERSGSLICNGNGVGSLSGANVLITGPDLTVSLPKPQYSTSEIGTEKAGNSTVKRFRTTLTGFSNTPTQAVFPAGGTVTAKYRPAGGNTVANEVKVLDSIDIDLTPGYAERITAGSVRFRLGGSRFIAQAGAIYRDPAPDTGAGTLAGTIDNTTGRVMLTSWTAGTATVTLDAMVTEVGSQAVDECVFRAPVSPLKSGTVQIRWSDLAGNTYDKTPDGTGILVDNDCTIAIDYTRGVVRMRFGRWRTVASLTADDMAEPWYSADSIVDRGGVPSIWQSRPADPSSVVYNAVAATYLPPDSDLLGLDAARLPPDGRALIYRTGMLCLVHHTATKAVETLSAGQTVDCERTRLYWVSIEDSTGAVLPADQYVVNRAAGTLTMATPLDQSGFTAPWSVRHTIADLRRVRLTDINGTLTLTGPLTHDYPEDEAQVSGVLYIGTLQARAFNVFAQSTWTSVWSDDPIGSEPLAQFNDALYPIVATNAGAYPDRILVRFTSASDFQVIGENLGFIAIGSINQDCQPINALTGKPYFKIPHQGWGGGWATGNCLRFNLAGACYPVDLIRATQPSDPSGNKDSVEVLLVGNVDA